MDWLSFGPFEEQALGAQSVRISSTDRERDLRARSRSHRRYTDDIQTSPENAPSTTERDCKSRPDGYAMFSDASDFWTYLLCLAEFKKGDSDRDRRDVRNPIFSVRQSSVAHFSPLEHPQDGLESRSSHEGRRPAAVLLRIYY